MSQRAAASLAGGCSTSYITEPRTYQPRLSAWTPNKRVRYSVKRKQFASDAVRQLTRYFESSLRSTGTQQRRTGLCALPADDEEAQLTADYGALSERFEVRCCLTEAYCTDHTGFLFIQRHMLAIGTWGGSG